MKYFNLALKRSVVWMLLILSSAADDSSRDFKEHTRSVVTLKLQHGRPKREITSTEDATGSHHREVTITMSTGSEEYELELLLNEGLIPRGHSLSYQQNGLMRVYVPEKEESELCQYSGRVRGEPDSWVAVSTCRGVSGAIFDGRRLRHIEPKHDDINAEHFLYTHEPMKEQRGWDEDAAPRHPKLLLNRTPKSRVIKEPYGADESSRYVELVLVVDNEGYLASGSDLQATHLKMKNLANVLNTMYASLNIFIALVGVEVWTENDKIKMKQKNESNEKKLNNFLEYRTTELQERIPNDSAFLITWASFEDFITAGFSYPDTMCTYYSGGVLSSADGFRTTENLAVILAHEIGHTLGMKHDEDCTCPDETCIMYPFVSKRYPRHWSSCSQEYLNFFFTNSKDHCLHNKPQSLFSSATCGNGFVEEGEQCDCGIEFDQLSPKMFAACTESCYLNCTFKDSGSDPTNATASTPLAVNNSTPQTAHNSTSQTVNTSTSHPVTPSMPQSTQTVTPTTPKTVTPSTSQSMTPSTSEASNRPRSHPVLPWR